MLKITRSKIGNAVRLKLEGKLYGDWVDEFRRIFDQETDNTVRPELDLSDVTFVDHAGSALLEKLRNEGTQVPLCSNFISELLHWGDQIMQLATADNSRSLLDVDESNLVDRLRNGEEAACEHFVRNNTERMLTLARRLLRDEHEAADAVQEGFLAAFRSIRDFAGGAKLSTWLHRIVVNVCLMKLRSAKSKPTRSIENLLPAFDDTGHHAQQVAAWVDSPAEQLHSAELRIKVRAAINELPASYRTVLILRDIEELDTEETALRLGITVAAVKVRLHRARLALRSSLDPVMRQGE